MSTFPGLTDPIAAPDTLPGAAAGHAAVMAARAPLTVSVVVPTWRRPEMLLRCLDAIAAQDFDPSDYEVLVCDDGPDAATRAAVEGFAARCAARALAVHYVPVTGTQGPAGARNRGWESAVGRIIAFTDDDTIPDPHWLTEGVSALAGEAAAATGRIVVPLPDAPTDYELDASGLSRSEFATANCFVSRAMLVAVGGFDERFTAAWREDSDLQFAIMRAGGGIVFAERAVVLHPVRPARWGVSLSQQKKSRYEALLYRKYPDLYRQRIASLPPWRYYLTLASVAMAVGAAIAHDWPLAATGAALWLALTAWFCIQRLARTAKTPSHILEMAWTSIAIPPLSIFWRLAGAVQYRVFFL
jgi:GT2 family glycosyltransferase